MKRLYFIRHGESEANLRGVWSDNPDSKLTQKGVGQAQKVADELRNSGLSFDLIIASPYERTKQTARIIARTIGYPEETLIMEPLATERRFGGMEGIRQQDFLQNNKYQDIDEVNGAETIEQLQERARVFYEKIQAIPEADVLLVGHGAFFRALRRVIQGLPPSEEYSHDFTEMQIPNAEVIQLI